MSQKIQGQAQSLSGSPQPNFTSFSPKPVLAQRAPTSMDTGFPLGQEWVDKVSHNVYFLGAVAAGVATWNLATAASGPLNTLTGNSGGALSPTSNNINIVGSGALSIAGSGSTLTGSITPGSSLIATVTGNSGGALSPTSGNIGIVGSGAFSIAGSGSTLTGSITPGTALIATVTGDSGGALSPTAGNLGLVGTASQIAFAGSGSTLTGSLSSSLVLPGTLTVSGTANINATGAAVTTIGNTSGGATNLVSGTTLTIDTAATGAINIWPSLTSGIMTIGPVGVADTGQLRIFPGTGNDTITIAHNAGNKTVRIADGGTNNVVVIGVGAGTSSVTLQGGSGGVSLNSTTGFAAINAPYLDFQANGSVLKFEDKSTSTASIGTTSAMSGTPGSLTVTTSACTVGSQVFVQRATAGGTLGNISVPVATVGAGSFVINSDANETSTFFYWIIN